MARFDYTDLAKSVLPYMQTSFMGGYKMAATKWQQIAVKVPSTMKIETYPWVADHASPHEWLSKRYWSGGAECYVQVTNSDYDR